MRILKTWDSFGFISSVFLNEELFPQLNKEKGKSKGEYYWGVKRE